MCNMYVCPTYIYLCNLNNVNNIAVAFSVVAFSGINDFSSSFIIPNLLVAIYVCYKKTIFSYEAMVGGGERMGRE